MQDHLKAVTSNAEAAATNRLRQLLKQSLAKITKSHRKSKKETQFSCGKNRVQPRSCWHLKSFFENSQINIDPVCSGL